MKVPPISAPAMAARRVSLVFLATLFTAMTLFGAGCVTKRPSGLIGEPINLTDPVSRERLEAVLRSPDLQMAGPSEYYLGPGDVISIQLLGSPEILGGTRYDRGSRDEGPNRGLGGVEMEITESPMISLPLVGAVKVHGKTASEVQEELASAYSQYIRDPRPLVLVQHFEQNQVTVLGAVENPGAYPYEFGDTIMEGIFKAGGLSMGGRTGGLAPGQFLRIYRQRITREEQSKLSMEQLIERLTSQEGTIVPRDEIAVPLREMVFGATLDFNLPLRPDDVLYIAPAGTAHVQGRVRSPGVVFLGPSVTTLTQVITEQGGLKFSADSIVEVKRVYPDEQNVSYFLNARDMIARKDRDFVIQDGDQIMVYGTTLRAIGEWLGDLFRGSVTAGANATYNPVTGI